MSKKNEKRVEQWNKYYLERRDSIKQQRDKIVREATLYNLIDISKEKEFNHLSRILLMLEECNETIVKILGN